MSGKSHEFLNLDVNIRLSIKQEFWDFQITAQADCEKGNVLAMSESVNGSSNYFEEHLMDELEHVWSKLFYRLFQELYDPHAIGSDPYTLGILPID